MPSARDILGMNARVQLYTALNNPRAKSYGFSKLRAKKFLAKHEISVPQLYAQITSQEELREFDWHSISGSFAVKPANGSAGSGILVIKRRSGNKWISVENDTYEEDDLDLHASDILEGQYSTWGSRHMVIVEERVPLHPDLENYAQIGTPDVRVIVFHRVPVMAMLRLPTEASHGRANLHQGAIALGIDFGTGKTTYGVDGKIAYSLWGNRRLLQYFPESNLPISGIEIPFWTDVLRTAVRVANATGLEYAGVDIFLHPEKGPMVAEVNAYPGLSIQLANNAGLRRRLQRLEDIKARNVSHAVKLAQTLFAENYPALSPSDVDRPILQPREEIQVYDDEDKPIEAEALINTGRFRSVIGENLASQLMLNQPHDELWRLTEENEGQMPVIEVRIKIKDRIITTTMVVSKRLNKKKHQIELGRNDLGGFLVNGSEL
jgi:alpha-L-glutamate ligase-like protein